MVILYLTFWGTNCKAIFHNPWTLLHTHQKYTRISISLYAPWHLLLSVLDYRRLSGCEIISYCDLISWIQGKNPPTNVGDVDSIPGSVWSLGEGNGNPHQYSCLGNPTNRGTWQTTVQGGHKIAGHDGATKQQQRWLIVLCIFSSAYRPFGKMSSQLLWLFKKSSCLSFCCWVVRTLHILDTGQSRAQNGGFRAER